MQQFYTLEEAAKVLQISSDDLREMAKKKEVRAFQDRGSWRFRAQDIQEMARERGIGSGPDLMLGEAAKAAKRPADSDLLPVDFELSGGPKTPRSGNKLSGKSGPKPGSDSDVRLVMEGGKGDPDSDVRLDEGNKPSSSKKKKTDDSSVRLVGPDAPVTDSSVVALGEKRPSDSDIRLHEVPTNKKNKDKGVITEEIDLDAEEAKARESGKIPRKGARLTQHAKPGDMPASSPYELSESDVKLPGSKSKSSPPKTNPPAKKKGDTDSSSDFELIPFDSTKAPSELGSGEIPLLDDDKVNLGSEVRSGKGGSGINLTDPADSGISLEGSGEVDFELSAGGAAAGKKGKSKADDSSSEFELSLDDSPSDPSDSEFELNLDDSGSDLPAGESGSDSEFELTLDDEGQLGTDDDAKDIFEETNFDVPAIDKDSGSEAVALDSESSEDFEISLEEINPGSKSGSAAGSQVVAIDGEGEADDAAATVARPRKAVGKAPAKKKPSGESDEGLDFDLEMAESGPKKKPAKKRPAAVIEEDEDDDDEAPVGAGAAPAAREWGALPAILLLPTVAIMFVVGLMGFEMVRSMWGFQRSTKVATPVVDTFKKMAE